MAVYDAVARANNVMHLAGLIKDELPLLPGQEKDFYTEAIAQARFMRGFYLFEGIKNFGAAIPYVSLEDYESSVNPLISNVDESGNYIYIWEQVLKICSMLMIIFPAHGRKSPVVPTNGRLERFGETENIPVFSL